MRNRSTLAFVLAAVMLLMLFSGCAKSQAPQTEEILQTIPEEIGTEPPTTPPVHVEVSKYELSYSGHLQDVLRWAALEDGSDGLAFTVVLDSGEYPVFTMLFDSDDGDMVIMVSDHEENKIPVAFRMAELPDNVEGDEAVTFYAAQEAVNDVVASLTIK